MPAGFDVGTTSTSRFRVKMTGFCTRPFANNCSGIVVFAEAKTSAGAPCVICAASVLEAPNEYFGPESILGNTAVSDEAAYTVIPLTRLEAFTLGCAAAAPV